MVRIRLQRLGRRNRPFYRINAIAKRTRRDGRVIENLGWYDPVASDPAKQVSVNGERVRHWLSVGAQPSDTVRDLLARLNLLTAEERKAWEAQREIDRKRVDARKAAAPASAEA
ncbi:MAG: 30S ribosomal protein S16 [Phycisphaeraceae bacterium]|nr:30S ribosomal protein S16 [Phycisphaeraceae bacterium]